MSLPVLSPQTVDMLLRAILEGRDMLGRPLDYVSLGEVFTEEFLEQCPDRVFPIVMEVLH